jgi:hypothetical protein
MAMRSDISARVAGALEATDVDGVVSVYLFGSHAEGRTHRESDVDIGVVLDRTVHPTRQARFEARLRLLGHVAAALGTNRVDLVVLNDAPPHLARRILTEGRRLVCADPDLDHAARRTALSRAADLEPFLRRARATKLRAIAR